VADPGPKKPPEYPKKDPFLKRGISQRMSEPDPKAETLTVYRF